MTEKNRTVKTPHRKSRKAKKSRRLVQFLTGLFVLTGAVACLWLFVASLQHSYANESENSNAAGTTVAAQGAAAETDVKIAGKSGTENGNAGSRTKAADAQTAADAQSNAAGQTAAEKEEEAAGLANAAEIKAQLLREYPWSMTVRCEGRTPETFVLSNLVEHDMAALAEEIASGGHTEYKLEYTLDEERLQTDLNVMNYLWSEAAVNSSITGYSDETAKFSYSEPKPGITVNAEKLKADIEAAIADGDLSRVINAEMMPVEPEIDQEEAARLYKTIGTYITHSTANPDRNNNLRLACEAINGSYLAPGESFSFNLTTGNRTEEKGYKPAGAYQNGVTVQEPGGGVCQVASTLYNAAIRAGLKVTERHNHTYEPSYVTPGEDATVSYDGYDGPDLAFVNNTKAGIVIRASYADQTVMCSIIGIPILGAGEEVRLHSTKIETSDLIVQYVEDPTLPAGEQAIKSNGSKGSRWETYIQRTKNGQVVSDDLLHTSQYAGHPQVIRVGTAVLPELPLPQELPEEQFVTGPNGGPGVSPTYGNIVHGGPGTIPEENASGSADMIVPPENGGGQTEGSGQTAGEQTEDSENSNSEINEE